MSKVILAETQSEHWLAANWRPISALAFVFSILFFGLIEPVFVAWFGVKMVQPDVKVLEWHYQLTTICLGGYMASGTIEKVVGMIIGRRK